MNIEIITQELTLDLYGFSGTAENKDYSGTAFRLSDKMWKAVKSNNLKNKGLNIWVYEPGEKVFAGVELLETPQNGLLEQKNIHLIKYARYKHVGAYNLIKQSGQNMTNEIIQRGFEARDPYIEIYGHWTNDVTKLETELIMGLK